MKKMHQARIELSDQARRVAIAVLILLSMALTQAPANAQANSNQFFTNANGTMDGSNDQTAKDILDRYNLRFPWNAINKRFDKLKKIDDPEPSEQQRKDTRLPEKREEFPTDGRSAKKDESKSNTLESEESQSPKRVLAYDSCFVMCGMPTGWFLQDAEAWKFPKGTMNQYICYYQPKMIAMDKVLTKRDEAIFEKATGFEPPGIARLTTYGLPMSDTQFQLIDRENKQRFLELLWDPERFLWAFTGTTQIAAMSAGNSLAGNAESAFDNASLGVANGYTGSGALINIANEASGTGPNLGAYYRRVSDAVKQVQIMYHQVYVPLAILFLLPGAVATQAKSIVAQGFSLKSPETQSPFDGILRSMVAVFLIPSTQLIVSYAIDVGNSMAYSVYDPWVNLDKIKNWTHNLSYNPPVNNVDNAILPPESPQQQQSFWQRLFSDPLGTIIGLLLDLFGFGEGLGGNTPETKTTHEHMSALSSILEGIFNMMMLGMSYCLITLTAFQVVFMCYLFLLGPLAAAFYAWPDLQNQNSSQNLFRGVFGNWVKAVITLALWRFYWMVILAIMTQRLIYLSQSSIKSNLQWEVAVFTCLLGLMLYVPFNPFDFDPAKAYEAVQKNATGGGGGGGAGGGGAGGPGGAAGAGGGPPLLNTMQNAINQMPDSPLKEQLTSAVAATREGFDRTASTQGRQDPGANPIGPYQSSAPPPLQASAQPGAAPSGPPTGGDDKSGGDKSGTTVAAVVPPPTSSTSTSTGTTTPPTTAGTGTVTPTTASTKTDTGTPSAPADVKTAQAKAPVTSEHMSAYQQNMQAMLTMMKAAGLDTSKFEQANDPQKYEQQLLASSGGSSSSGGDDEEEKRKRVVIDDDDTDTA